MKYALTRDLLSNKPSSFTFEPWKKMGLTMYEKVSQVPDDRILIASHFAPWWTPLKEYIDEGRPWIEIEYGYWGKDSPRRETRRVTYKGHHNLQMKPLPFSRSHLFQSPQLQSWKQSQGEYVLGILPVEEIIKQRTGENLIQFRERLEKIIRQYWSGTIRWRRKGGPSQTRFENFKLEIENAYAVVGERTMACVESCLLGVPAFTVDKSMTTLLMGGIENLKELKYPDRAAWWEHICWSQFNREEFDSTLPAELTEQYQIQL